MSDLSVTINADTTKFISAVKESKKELDLFDKSNKQLRSTMMKVNDVTEEQVNAFKNSVNSLNKVSSGTKNTKQSISILKDEVKKLSIQFNNLSDTAKKSKFGDTISNQVRKARTELERLKNIDKELKNSTIIKKDSELFKGVGDSIKDFSSLASAFNSGGLVSALGNLAGPLSVVTAGFAGLNEVIKNNETLLDTWQGIVSGAGTAWTNFMRTFNFFTIGASFKAGQNLYNATDAIGSYRALNSAFLGNILYKIQKAKTDKSEGKPWSKKQLEELNGEINYYYDQDIELNEAAATDLKKVILSGLEGDAYTKADEYLNAFAEAKNKYAKLEEFKSELKIGKKRIDKLENKELEKFKGLGIDESTKLQQALINSKRDNKNLYAQVEALSYLINSESSLNDYVKISNEVKKLSQEEKRQIKEVNEARAESKDKIEKNIQDLYKNLDEQYKIIYEEDKKPLSNRELGRRYTALEEYKKIEEKIYKQFGQFEGENSQAFWKEWTNVEHAILEGKDINEAIKKARANILKYITEKSITIDEFISDINETQKNLGKNWKWYEDITKKYYKDDFYGINISDRILIGVGSSEDILNIIYENIEKDINQLKSKYPEPKSQSYFKEVADIYDKNLKYLANKENELESLKKKRDEILQKIAKLINDYDEDEKDYLRENYKSKLRRYLETPESPFLGHENQAKIDAENAYSVYIDYENQFKEKLDELEQQLVLLDEKIPNLEESLKPYQEIKNKRDKILQDAGIRPYHPFVFNDYKKDTSGEDRIKLLNLEANAVSNLASAWNNLGEVISIENDKIKQVMQAFGNFVADTANMLKTLAENELAASQAVALGKATSSASGLPFPYNLVAMATVAASVTSMFARFASIGKFAEGGIVGGSSLGGDQMIARVNSGEMILNGSQQKKLFNLLNGNGTNTSTSIPEIKVRIAGSDLVGVLDNYGKKLNRVR